MIFDWTNGQSFMTNIELSSERIKMKRQWNKGRDMDEEKRRSKATDVDDDDRWIDEEKERRYERG